MAKRISLFFLTLGLMLSVGCSGDKNIEVMAMNSSIDLIMASDLQEMISKADVIVVGKYQKYVYSVNGEKDPREPNKEHPTLYSEHRVYDFKVEETLKGDVSDHIQVELPFTSQMDGLRDEDGNPVIITTKKGADDQPDFSKKYILFLVKTPEGRYHGGFTPFQIMVDNNHKTWLKLPKEKKTIGTDQNGKPYELYVEGVDHYHDQITGKDVDEVIAKIKESK